MKSLFLIPFIFLFSFCVKKEIAVKPPVDVIDTTQGKVEFSLDGKNADKFHTSALKIDNKTILYGSKNEIFENQLVPFHNITICFENKSLKKQKLFNPNQDDWYSDSTKCWAFFSSSEDDGDAVCETFRVNETDSMNNWIQVTKQQNDYGEIWGNFSVSFVKVQDCNNRFYSDKIIIRNGYFHVFVKEKS